MPTASPPHKEIVNDPGADVRERMCRLLVDSVDGVEVSDLELKRAGVSYTVDTVQQLKELDPSCDIFLIVGADAAATFLQWQEPEEILKVVTLCVVNRPGESLKEVRSKLAGELFEGKVLYVEAPSVDVSSTRIRELVAAGDSVSGMTSEAVARYISKQGIYREGRR